MTREPVPWSVAWRSAHLGAHLGADFGAHPGSQGFYRHHEPARHFATEAQADATVNPLAHALAVLISDTADWLPNGQPVEVVDIGAGSGELLTALLHLLDADPRVHFTAIDVRPRPRDLPDRIEWITGSAPEVVARHRPDGVRGVILAHEWLDDLPVDVVARDAHAALRHVLVDPVTGVESMGDAVRPDDATHLWLDEWWGPVLDRAEVGLHRDAAWRRLCAALGEGVALAIDYGHTRGERERFAAGSIIGYREGATHWPIPDGSMNLTAHVTWESLAAATDPPGMIRSQVEALTELLPPVSSPDIALAETDPHRFARLLQQHSQRSRILDRSVGVSWLTVVKDDGSG